MPEENKTVIGNIETVEVGNDFGIKANDSPFAVSFYFDDYYDDKIIKQFVKNVEKLIRSSKEYKTYIELLRTNVFALNHDSVMSNITTADVDLEFHHTPLTLYDIVEIFMLEHIVKNEKFTSFSIAKEVMNAHFKHQIGLTPLTKTTHELVHSGNLIIKETQVFGDYKTFFKEHQAGFSTDQIQKLENFKALSTMNVPVDYRRLL